MLTRLLAAGTVLSGALVGLFVATHWAAHLLHQHPALGHPVTYLAGWALYAPWAYATWYLRWADAPGVWGQAMVTAGWAVIAGMGLGAAGALVLRLRSSTAPGYHGLWLSALGYTTGHHAGRALRGGPERDPRDLRRTISVP